MDGIQLLKEIRETVPNARVIVMSATEDLGTMIKMKEFGARDFITKPFHFARVLQKVEKALEGGNKKAEN